MAANTIFLDTNGWFVLLSRKDGLHERANALWRKIGGADVAIVLTDWVVAETGNGLARTSARMRFVESVASFQRTSRFRIVTVSPDLRERALKLYGERSDKSWGLVDCASFIVMSEMGITDAFTTDWHFEQAGFNCLLPASAE
jgi:hypothetical protein